MIATVLWELRRRRTAIVWWTIGSVVTTVFILALFPSIRDQAQDLNKVINSLPEGVRGLKAGGEATVNVADPISFLNSQLFYITLPILWIIQAITRGSGILGRDEQDRTLELLLARPTSRGRLLLAKSASIFVEFAIVGAATLAAIVLLAPAFGMQIGAWPLAEATLYTLAFSLSFGLIAFALQAASVLTRRLASVLAVLISFGGYLVASLSSLTDWLEAPAKLMPYHYFAPDKIMQGHVPTGLNVYLAATVVITAAVAYFGFRRRDIN
jgi:ABC-2 type transport system permease protein